MFHITNCGPINSFTIDAARGLYIQKNLTSNNLIPNNDYDLKEYIELAKSH